LIRPVVQHQTTGVETILDLIQRPFRHAAVDNDWQFQRRHVDRERAGA
jgi:hypothetical protein